MAGTRVLLVDDYFAFRDLLVVLAEGTPDIDVVGTATTGIEAVRLAGELEPDVVILDYYLTDMTGDVVAWLIRRRVPAARVIVCSSYDIETSPLLLEVGIAGVTSKALLVPRFAEMVRGRGAA